tara:strand:- start:177 stop:446 length:270 start_codon:yes stop_codon:yes gene_type:complete
MTNEPLTKKVSNRICSHMNKDHQDSLIQYAIHYGGIPNAKAARMIDINNKSMRIVVDEKTVEIKFDHELQDSKDAHQTLVSMLKSLASE